METQVTINQIYNYKMTALHAAAYYGQPNCCKELIDHEIDLNARNVFGETLLLKAAEKVIAYT